MTKASGCWYRAIARASLQSAGQSSAIVPVVVYQVWYRVAAVLLGEIELSPCVLLNVIVFHVRMWAVTIHTVSSVFLFGERC